VNARLQKLNFRNGLKSFDGPPPFCVSVSPSVCVSVSICSSVSLFPSPLAPPPTILLRSVESIIYKESSFACRVRRLRRTASLGGAFG